MFLSANNCLDSRFKLLWKRSPNFLLLYSAVSPPCCSIQDTDFFKNFMLNKTFDTLEHYSLETFECGWSD
jgi:hypothetical protein